MTAWFAGFRFRVCFNRRTLCGGWSLRATNSVPKAANIPIATTLANFSDVQPILLRSQLLPPSYTTRKNKYTARVVRSQNKYAVNSLGRGRPQKAQLGEETNRLTILCRPELVKSIDRTKDDSRVCQQRREWWWFEVSSNAKRARFHITKNIESGKKIYHSALSNYRARWRAIQQYVLSIYNLFVYWNDPWAKKEATAAQEKSPIKKSNKYGDICGLSSQSSRDRV